MEETLPSFFGNIVLFKQFRDVLVTQPNLLKMRQDFLSNFTQLFEPRENFILSSQFFLKSLFKTIFKL